MVLTAELEHDVGNTRLVVLADGMAAIDADFDMQSVIDQQHGGGSRRLTLVAGELLHAFQTVRPCGVVANSAPFSTT